MTEQVAGVLMAAGLSTRMGRPKQLALLAGKPLCTHAAEALADAPYSYLLAVIPGGQLGEEIRAALADLPFEFAVNPDPARGMASSFRVAVEALPDGLAANFALADMPLLTARAHRAMLDAFWESHLAVGSKCSCGDDHTGADNLGEKNSETRVPVVLAEYGKGTDLVRAPPHLFRADLLAEILASPDADHGPRHLVKKYAADGLAVYLPTELLLDVDTPEALAQAEAWLAKQNR